MIAAGSGVVAGAVFLTVAMNVPPAARTLFIVAMGFTGVTMSMAAPNVSATIQDIAEPEVRATALAALSFVEGTGAALAPWLAGIIADRSSLRVAILAICVAAWVLCAAVFAALSRVVPADIRRLREAMRARAAAAAGPGGAAGEGQPALTGAR